MCLLFFPSLSLDLYTYIVIQKHPIASEYIYISSSNQIIKLSIIIIILFIDCHSYKSTNTWSTLYMCVCYINYNNVMFYLHMATTLNYPKMRSRVELFECDNQINNNVYFDIAWMGVRVCTHAQYSRMLLYNKIILEISIEYSCITKLFIRFDEAHFKYIIIFFSHTYDKQI